jgi:tryptophanyl-tRNA synthetase
MTLLSAFTGSGIHEIENAYAGKGYGDLKGDVAEAYAQFAEPLQAKVAEYLDDPAELDRLLAAGSRRASEVAETTVRTVYDRLGFLQAP